MRSESWFNFAPFRCSKKSLQHKNRQKAEENLSKQPNPSLNLSLNKSHPNTFRSNCDKLSTSRSIQMMGERANSAENNTATATATTRARCISPIYFPSINQQPMTTPRNSITEDHVKTSASARTSSQRYKKYYPNSARPRSLTKRSSEPGKHPYWREKNLY